MPNRSMLPQPSRQHAALQHGAPRCNALRHAKRTRLRVAPGGLRRSFGAEPRQRPTPTRVPATARATVEATPVASASRRCWGEESGIAPHHIALVRWIVSMRHERARVRAGAATRLSLGSLGACAEYPCLSQSRPAPPLSHSAPSHLAPSHSALFYFAVSHLAAVGLTMKDSAGCMHG